MRLKKRAGFPLWVLLIAVLLAPCHGWADTFQFAGMDWGSPPEVVAQRLKKQGFTINNQSSTRLSFSGQLIDYPVFGFALFDENGGLSGVKMRAHPAYYEVIGAFRKMRDAIAAKYGSPDHNTEYLSLPQCANCELRAITAGQAKFLADWDGETSIGIEIDRSLDIRIEYANASRDAAAEGLLDGKKDLF